MFSNRGQSLLQGLPHQTPSSVQCSRGLCDQLMCAVLWLWQAELKESTTLKGDQEVDQAQAEALISADGIFGDNATLALAGDHGSADFFNLDVTPGKKKLPLPPAPGDAVVVPQPPIDKARSMMGDMMKQIGDSKKVCVELEGYSLCGELSQQLDLHAKRVELAWKMTQGLVSKNTNTACAYDKINAKFDVWTDWYTPRFQAAQASLIAHQAPRQGREAHR
jgi:hypothetical protein